MPARLPQIDVLPIVLVITSSFAWCLEIKIDKQVPTNAAESDPQGHLVVRVDETSFPFSPVPEDDRAALREVLMATPELQKDKNLVRAWDDAEKIIDGLAPTYGPIFIARFDSKLGPGDRPLARSPQFIQFAATQTIANDSVLWSWEYWAKHSDFYGNEKHPIGTPATDPADPVRRWWVVDQIPEKQNELPDAPTYQDFKTPENQALTDRSCAMWDIPGLITPWKLKDFKPGTQVIHTNYFQTWLVSDVKRDLDIVHRPMGYIDWKFDIVGRVGKDEVSTELTIRASSCIWRDSADVRTDLYAILVSVNYPRFP